MSRDPTCSEYTEDKENSPNGSSRIVDYSLNEESSDDLSEFNSKKNEKPGNINFKQNNNEEDDFIKPGTIHSITLTNFQTYSHAQFTFHPRLNYICGPNGSGKSTIANAFAFIFGGTAKAIGKSKEINDFIKFNSKHASIEVLIYGEMTGKKVQNTDRNSLNNSQMINKSQDEVDDERNHKNLKNLKISNTQQTVQLNNKNQRIWKIKRFIDTQRSTKWFLDDVLVPYKRIQKIYNSFNIDINNICNYLPQEKVNDFSKYTNEDLFRTVTEIYKNDEVSKSIEKINNMESGLDTILSDKSKLINEKNVVEKTISHMYKDVKLIEEKDILEKKIKLMKHKLNWLYYDKEKEKYFTLKQKLPEIN